MDDLKGKISEYLAKGGRVTVGRTRKAFGSHTFISRSTIWYRGRKATNLRMQGIYASNGGS
jgi:DNA-binding Lrp family transcriptional regulator